MFGTIKTKPRYIGKGRRKLGISLEWPRDGDTSRATARMQRFERRRDGAGNLIYTPLGTGWTIDAADVSEVALELGLIADLIKVGKL